MPSPVELLFDLTDPRYDSVANVLFDDWQAPVTSKMQSDFDAFEVERSQTVIANAIQQTDSVAVVQEALFEALHTFEESFRLHWLIGWGKVPAQVKDWIDDEMGDAGDLSSRLAAIIKRGRRNELFRQSVVDVVNRSHDMSLWLLPHAGLEAFGESPIEIAAACQEILDVVPSVEAKRAAAKVIHRIVSGLEVILNNRDAQPAPAGEEEAAQTTAEDASLGEYAIRRIGRGWEITFQGHRHIQLDSYGLRYIVEVIQKSPGDVAGVDLHRMIKPSKPGRPGSPDAVVSEELIKGGLHAARNPDPTTTIRGAREDLEEERRTLQREIDEARRNNDPAKTEEIRKYLEQIERDGTVHVAHSQRRIGKAVSKAINTAIKLIHKEDKNLAEHLHRFLHRGQRNCYRPDSPIPEWRIDD